MKHRDGVTRFRSAALALVAAAAGGLVSALGASRAAEEGMWAPGVGRDLAERWCSGCHVTGPLTASPAGDVGPPFPLVAATPGITPLALRVFLQTPHRGMPDLRLDPDEVDAIVAYIVSLRK